MKQPLKFLFVFLLIGAMGIYFLQLFMYPFSPLNVKREMNYQSNSTFLSQYYLKRLEKVREQVKISKQTKDYNPNQIMLVNFYEGILPLLESPLFTEDRYAFSQADVHHYVELLEVPTDALWGEVLEMSIPNLTVEENKSLMSIASLLDGVREEFLELAATDSFTRGQIQTKLKRIHTKKVYYLLGELEFLTHPNT